MQYQGGIKHVKNVLITALRAFFANPDNFANLLPPNLPSTAFAQMEIYDTHPQQLRTFPMIVISGSSGRMVAGGISNDFAMEVHDEFGNLKGYKYGGFFEFNCEVEVGTRTTLEREVLMDITVSALRFSLRRRMEYHGVLIKEASYGGENKLQYDSDFIYTSLVNLQIFSEWYEYFDLLPVKDINVQSPEVLRPFSKSKVTAQSRYIDKNILPNTESHYDHSARNILNYKFLNQ